RAARDGQSGKLADQMVVRRRRIRRQVMHDEVAVAIDRIEPAIPEALAFCPREERRAGAARDAVREVPVDQPDAELQRAAPVCTSEVRTLVDPAVDQTS